MKLAAFALLALTRITKPAPDGVNEITYYVDERTGIVECQSITTVDVRPRVEHAIIKPIEINGTNVWFNPSGDPILPVITPIHIDRTNILYKKINDYSSEVIDIIPSEPPHSLGPAFYGERILMMDSDEKQSSAVVAVQTKQERKTKND